MKFYVFIGLAILLQSSLALNYKHTGHDLTKRQAELADNSNILINSDNASTENDGQSTELESNDDQPKTLKSQNNNHLDQIQKALQHLLNILEKMFIFVAVFMFMFIQYLFYKLACFLHNRCTQHKEQKKLSNLDLKSQPIEVVQKY
ncbi:hypothetical protein M3Y97_00121000 [Aphelenchoides bicaudatus]|nr:hypothetical protein M3Y97_00121000 [Aphelenchoides bicaudatus]